jgi:hypothetical protein
LRAPGLAALRHLARFRTPTLIGCMFLKSVDLWFKLRRSILRRVSLCRSAKN